MSKTLHNVQPKHCGCVTAEFVVEPDLPEGLRVGVFKQPRSYPAWIRFSNQNGTVQSDIKGDIQGMSIKFLAQFSRIQASG